jgi:hypothetical protein
MEINLLNIGDIDNYSEKGFLDTTTEMMCSRRKCTFVTGQFE